MTIREQTQAFEKLIREGVSSDKLLHYLIENKLSARFYPHNVTCNRLTIVLMSEHEDKVYDTFSVTIEPSRIIQRL